MRAAYFGLAVIAPAIALATPTAQAKADDVVSGVPAAALFSLADQARAAGRIVDAEAIYKALANDADIDIRNEARFRMGLMLAEQKDYTAAALAFRAIIDEKPESSGVRLELARVLAAMGDEGRARAQLRQAQASGLPPDVAQVVDQFAAALRSTRLFGGTLELALAPDSNINRATDAKTLDTPLAPLNLSDDARQRSGLGARLSGQVYLRIPIAQRISLAPRLSGDGTLYRDSRFNDLSGSALIGLEWRGQRDRVTPSLGSTWRYYGGSLYARTQTADLRWTRTLSRRAQADLSLSFGRTDYRLNALQDGNLYNVALGLERAFSARTGGGLTFSATRQTARDPGYSTASAGVTVIGYRDMGKLTLFANASLSRLEADAAIYPFERRKDWFMRGLVGATFRQIEVAGFSPVVRAAFERNISTFGIYDYRRVKFDIGITRAF